MNMVKKKKKVKSFFGDMTPEEAAKDIIAYWKTDECKKKMKKHAEEWDKIERSMRPKTRNGEMIIY